MWSFCVDSCYVFNLEMSHKDPVPVSTSPFNVPVSTGETARKKIDLPKNIGFRGRHAHGKAPDDPVYPTRQLGPSPRMGFVDWRTGGRALLVAAMAAIEGKILRTRHSILKWQMFPTCSPMCGFSCHKASNRVLCAWFTPGTVHEHYTNMIGSLTIFKGAKNVRLNKPPVKPMTQVAQCHKLAALPMTITPTRMEPIEEQPDPAFGLEPINEDGYDSDEDPEEFGKDRLDFVHFDRASSEEAEFIANSPHL